MINSRRHFVVTSAITLASVPLVARFAGAQAKSPFRVAVISDEISQDFDFACSIIAGEFGLKWVELRGMWGKNLQNLDQAEIDKAQKILAKHDLQVTDIASPLYKTDWPGAPRSRFSPTQPDTKFDSFKADFSFKQQQDVLERSVALSRQFKTNLVRCFDFYRLADVAPHRAAINATLQHAAETCGRQGVLLVLENEFECNTATGREAAATLGGVPSPHLMLNWDAGNAVMAGELDAYPGGWDALPKQRIGHCHVKNAIKGADGKIQWSPVGSGLVDWTAQFQALYRSGYRKAVSLETHWRGAVTPEESTRQSWQGMKKALAASSTLA